MGPLRHCLGVLSCFAAESCRMVSDFLQYAAAGQKGWTSGSPRWPAVACGCIKDIKVRAHAHTHKHTLCLQIFLGQAHDDSVTI